MGDHGEDSFVVLSYDEEIVSLPSTESISTPNTPVTEEYNTIINRDNSINNEISSPPSIFSDSSIEEWQRVAEIIQENIQLKETIKQNNRAIEKFMKWKDGVRETEEANRKKFDAAKDFVEKQNRIIIEKTETIERLKEQILSNENNNLRSAELAEAREKIEELNGALRTLAVENQLLKQKAEMHKSAVADRVVLCDEVAQLKRQIDGQIKRIAAMETERIFLTEEAEDLRDKIRSEHELNSQLRDQLAAVEADFKDYRAENAEFGPPPAPAAEDESLKTRLLETESKLRESEQRLKVTRAESTAIVGDLVDGLEQLREENERLRKQVESQKTAAETEVCRTHAANPTDNTNDTICNCLICEGPHSKKNIDTTTQ